MKYVLSDELRSWVQNQLADGDTPDSIRSRLVANLWHRQAVQEAIDVIVTGAVEAANVSHPMIDMRDLPSTINAGGRALPVVMFTRSPRIFMVDGLLAKEECESLIEAAKSRLQPLSMDGLDSSSEEASALSTGTVCRMAFDRAETALVAEIERRIADLSGWPIDATSGVNVLSYSSCPEARSIENASSPDISLNSSAIPQNSKLMATLVVCLNSVEYGGYATFTSLGLDIVPQRGMAIMFSHADAPMGVVRRTSLPDIPSEDWILKVDMWELFSSSIVHRNNR